MSRPCTRSQSSKLSGKPVNLNMDNKGFRRLFDEALGPIREDIKSLESKDYLDAKINELEKRLLNKLELQSKEVKTLRKKVADLQDRLEVAELAIDDGEQYSRRMCLRIDGIPLQKGETENACIKKALNIAEEMGIKLSPDANDRAHRVGRTYVRKNDVHDDESRSVNDNVPRRVNIVNEEDGAGTASQLTSDQANGLQKGRLEQQMIVKFRSWKDRVLFYKNRKKLRSKKVRLDLTKH